MSKHFRTSFRKAMCMEKGQKAKPSEQEMSNFKVDAQPQFCCVHKDQQVTNNHGLRINRSRGPSSVSQTQGRQANSLPVEGNKVVVMTKKEISTHG